MIAAYVFVVAFAGGVLIGIAHGMEGGQLMLTLAGAIIAGHGLMLAVIKGLENPDA